MRTLLLAMQYLLVLVQLSSAAPIVWTGYDHTFTKADGVDPSSLAGQDRVSNSVALSRSNNGGGLINPLVETSYNKPVSPAGTRWAFPYANPNKTVAAWNHAELLFLPWADAFGSNTTGGPPATIGQTAVVHLIAEDIYLDWRLTDWTVRAGGGFAYQRASGTAIGDYNADGLISHADYDAWIAAFGTSAPLPDGNRDVTVDAADYTLWRDHFSVAAEVSSVPEPILSGAMQIALLVTLRLLIDHFRLAPISI